MIQYADESHIQGSHEWFRNRLGNVTGSKCGDLLVKGKGKDEVFGKTAKGYLYQLAAERDMNPAIVSDDMLFDSYLDFVEVNTKPIRWGHTNEPEAKRIFEKKTGFHVTEVISCKHDTIDHFAASPDGMVSEDPELAPFACIEVKCPGQQNFMLYSVEINDAESLKAVKPDYYWQTMAEMECTGVDKCFFVIFNPFQANPIHIAVIDKNEEDCALLRERVKLANEFIDNVINGRES